MARRKPVNRSAVVEFAKFAPVEGEPVVPQHEEWNREFIHYMRSEYGRHLGLDGFMAGVRAARATAVAECERGEFYTSLAFEWARHVLGPDADPAEVERLGFELHHEWSPCPMSTR